MTRVLFGACPNPGLFIHLLSVLRQSLSADAQKTLGSMHFSPLESGLAAARQSGEHYSVLLPIPAEDRRQSLQQCLSAVAEDVNAERCRVFFDYCNESARLALVETIVALVRQAGVTHLRAVTLVSQNRLLSQRVLPIGHQCADLFVVCGWHACKHALQAEGVFAEVGATRRPQPGHEILCLNATPRWHRLYLLLKLADAGLLDLHAPDHAQHCQIPYVSFPGLDYGKGGSIDLDAFAEQLVEMDRAELLGLIDPLLARTPLRVDSLEAQGNALALEIDIRHYRDSKLSLVTETGMDDEHLRITEKTLKPLALGQPFITFGHRQSLLCARELGYATYDDCLDNRYDQNFTALKRLEAGVASAQAFLQAYAKDPELRHRVHETNLANIRWTLAGFASHYYERFALPVLERICWMDGRLPPMRAAVDPSRPSTPFGSSLQDVTFNRRGWEDAVDRKHRWTAAAHTEGANPMLNAPTPRPKVFGIGWAKTGTTSLGACFRKLGFNHQSQNLALVQRIMAGDYVKVLSIATAKESFEDWPWIILFRQLDMAFPGSKFILTTRDPARWLRSYRGMIDAQGPPGEDLARIREFLYGIDTRTATDEQLLSRYESHHQEVVSYFRHRPGDLLVVDWEEGHGWAQLCGFLGLPVPDTPFPHLNRRV